MKDLFSGDQGREHSVSSKILQKGNPDSALGQENDLEFGEANEKECLRNTTVEDKVKMKRNAKMTVRSFISAGWGKKLNKDDKGIDIDSSSGPVRSSNKSGLNHSFTEAKSQHPPEGYQTDDSNKKSRGNKSES